MDGKLIMVPRRKNTKGLQRKRRGRAESSSIKFRRKMWKEKKPREQLF